MIAMLRAWASIASTVAWGWSYSQPCLLLYLIHQLVRWNRILYEYLLSSGLTWQRDCVSSFSPTDRIFSVSHHDPDGQQGSMHRDILRLLWALKVQPYLIRWVRDDLSFLATEWDGSRAYVRPSSNWPWFFCQGRGSFEPCLHVYFGYPAVACRDPIRVGYCETLPG